MHKFQYKSVYKVKNIDGSDGQEVQVLTNGMEGIWASMKPLKAMRGTNTKNLKHLAQKLFLANVLFEERAYQYSATLNSMYIGGDRSYF